VNLSHATFRFLSNSLNAPPVELNWSERIFPVLHNVQCSNFVFVFRFHLLLFPFLGVSPSTSVLSRSLTFPFHYTCTSKLLSTGSPWSLSDSCKSRALIRAGCSGCSTATRVNLYVWSWITRDFTDFSQSWRTASMVSPLSGKFFTDTSLPVPQPVWILSIAACGFFLCKHHWRAVLLRLVATLGTKSMSSKKVTKRAIQGVDVQKACETVMVPEAPMALRLQSNLLWVPALPPCQRCWPKEGMAFPESTTNNVSTSYKMPS